MEKQSFRQHEDDGLMPIIFSHSFSLISCLWLSSILGGISVVAFSGAVRLMMFFDSFSLNDDVVKARHFHAFRFICELLSSLLPQDTFRRATVVKVTIVREAGPADVFQASRGRDRSTVARPTSNVLHGRFHFRLNRGGENDY